jgi:hypothetical protein
VGMDANMKVRPIKKFQSFSISWGKCTPSRLDTSAKIAIGYLIKLRLWFYTIFVKCL